MLGALAPPEDLMRGVLFDKDGVLVDFNATWLAPYQQVAEYLAARFPGGPDAEALLHAGGWRGGGAWADDSVLATCENAAIMDFWETCIGTQLGAEERDYIDNFFRTATRVMQPVIADLPDCLGALKTRDFMLGVATMDNEANARAMAAHFKIDPLLGFICGADSGFGLKPDPGMLIAFAEAMRLPPAEVVMVGDSPLDLQMARAAGAGLAVGVTSGAYSADQLAGADYVLENIGRLPALLDSLLDTG